MTRYNSDDYNNISSSMKYILPDTVLNIIKRLGVELGVSVAPVDATPSHQTDEPNKRLNGRRGRLGNSKHDDHNGSDKHPAFKTTEIVKKEGIDKIFTEIKGCLNKLTIKNYDTIKASLFEHIESALAHPDGDEVNILTKIAYLVFDVASINKTFSELYAKLYHELIENNAEFKEHILTFKASYLENFNKIVFVDPDVDYNKYCDVTKDNDRRKNISLFLVNLMNNGLLKDSDILDILIELKDNIVKVTDTAGQNFYVEELIEVMNVYIKAAYVKLREHSNWNIIGAHIEQYTAYKAKEHPGLSSRIIFKYMDMKVIINKVD